MSAQRHDAAAGTADVAEQQLKDRCGADDLRPGRMLRPPDGVADRSRLVGPRPIDVVTGDAREHVARRTADAFDELRRVTREVLLQQLVHAARMLERIVAIGADQAGRLPAACVTEQTVPARRRLAALSGRLHALVQPGARVVLPLLLVPSGKEPVEILGIAEVFTDDRRGVGVVDDVLAKVASLLQDIVDDAPEQREVRPRAERNPDVRHRGRSRKSRIDVNDRGAALAGLDDEAETDRMLLGHGRAHDQHRVGIGQILQCGRRAAAPERCAQTGHGGAMSYPGLVADRHHAESGGEQLLDQIILLVVEGGAAEMRDRPHLHERLAVDLLDEPALA